MPKDAPSESIQDYVREIYKLEAEGERATTSKVASRVGVALPSATSMLKKLARLGLVEYVPYKGASLTPSGRAIGLEMTRHHRLIEQFLVQRLGLGIDEVHDEADRLEHALSEELEARLDASLGHPVSDPHGDPIPGPDLALDSRPLTPLANVAEGEQRVIRRVPDGDGDVLRYLTTLALVPGKRVQVRRAAPFGGPLTVMVEGVEHAISRELAASISVG